MRKIKIWYAIPMHFCKMREIIRSFLYGNDLIICWGIIHLLSTKHEYIKILYYASYTHI